MSELLLILDVHEVHLGMLLNPIVKDASDVHFYIQTPIGSVYANIFAEADISSNVPKLLLYLLKYT